MLLERLSEKVFAFDLAQCPDEAVRTAREAVLDTAGVTLAGAATDSARMTARALAGAIAPGPALVFGTRQTADPLNAALLNGVASHALDLDDCSNTMGGHPSVPVLPALWACAEAQGAGGEQMLAAYVVGVEVETKLGRAVNFHHYDIGWHPTATLGTFGAAAACARLLGLDAPRIAMALATAASMASGIKANFGTPIKPFHVGQTARNGLLAALLAREGMGGSAAALEHPQGFFAVYDGVANVAPERILDEWMAPCDLVDPGIGVKRHPCCASTHPAVDALLALREAHGLTPDTVAAVRSFTHPRRFRHTNRPDPRSGLEGKFSVQYALARALRHGVVSIEHFSDAAVQDPETRAIMAHIRSEADPQAVMETDEHFYADVEVVLTSGRVLRQHIDRPLGRDRAHPLPPGALEAKFLDCAGGALGREGAEWLMAELLRIDAAADVRHLTRGILARTRTPSEDAKDKEPA